MDQISLGDVYMVKILTKKELWTGYKLCGLCYSPRNSPILPMVKYNRVHLLRAIEYNAFKHAKKETTAQKKVDESVN